MTIKRVELAYKEHHAHDAICDFLEGLGFQPTRHAYGLETAFEVLTGEGPGRCINFNAEYDALPGLGHACGHNLISTASVTAFIALAYAIKKFGIKGKAQLLGTPAEEAGGGKIDLLNAGAYELPDVSLMIHPMSDARYLTQNAIGSGGATSLACYTMTCTYEGVSAHAAANPWEGINALDAVVASYNNVSMLRQQIKPDERIHGAIMEAPKITNAIPEFTKVGYTVRSPTVEGTLRLGERVRKCLEAGAMATGCKISLEEDPLYADLRVNRPLCSAFQANMAQQGEKILVSEEMHMVGSTDQGNVSHVIPTLHAHIGIPTKDDVNVHSRGFEVAAATQIANDRALKAGKAMAITGFSLLVDDSLYGRVLADFENE
ncbi:aminoacylase 1-like protein 2 [Arthroderma uncinatum]|uniref:aminoacylase 1-like protein 2 n=1 Tax=Arthroderma uncinatum TaxID=74035 RepID=UPI00144A74F6|nr:aminoacylase 1-like protein 2 [Arthroderma uncinatum]KAF3480937.1 aminoacylase 1-like protein 2 [Arthroderma uncinatum]